MTKYCRICWHQTHKGRCIAKTTVGAKPFTYRACGCWAMAHEQETGNHGLEP